jgi:myo-inositol-1(or 4)-monophosphatase
LPDADLSLLLATLREAGALALAMQRKGFSHRKKKDGTIVTDVDEAVDELLHNRISEARPGDGWLSEESPDTTARLGKSRLWIADPIDGTRGFLEGSGPWGIGMALAVDGAPVLSAIYQPADDLLTHAFRGGGCFANGVRVTSANRGNVITARRYKASLAAAGFTPETDSPIPLLLRLGSIARGGHGGAISIGDKNDWDIAAGHLLVTEAGGTISNLSGGGMIYNRPQPWQPGLIAAANPELHAALSDIVRTT